ncbi:hypothetical protein [uncultured Tateyamaria sp.]|uniref:hypothetical protein n=1 Tax=uncultured Tateyamaria sp. TaxID=455651 RepID=UPI00263879F5|nr:hypothetical protein [uncultured Tateyamaria sp.]
MRVRSLAICAALWAGPALAGEPAICDPAQPEMAGLCNVIETRCMPYLEDPASLSPRDIMPIPRTFRRYFESTLNSYALGYQETDLPNTLVVFMYDEPACEIISHEFSYSDLLMAFNEWRGGAGARFVSTTAFEPVSRVTMDRAFAAAFLAAPRRDGRVTEITLNWNLTFEGLTRLRVSYQPLRDHTADLMGVALK